MDVTSGKGVRHQKCEAPAGPFRLLEPDPFSAREGPFRLLVPEPFSAVIDFVNIGNFVVLMWLLLECDFLIHSV
jgi:hypothetical protein